MSRNQKVKVIERKKYETLKVLFYDVSKSDANALVSWWNAHTKYYHFRVRCGKLYKVVRQL